MCGCVRAADADINSGAFFSESFGCCPLIDEQIKVVQQPPMQQAMLTPEASG